MYFRFFRNQRGTKDMDHNCGADNPPHLVIYGDKLHIAKILVVIDGFPISFETADFKKGFDVLFKSYFVFDVTYPRGLETFFKFLEIEVYKISSKKTSNTKILELIERIKKNDK